MAEVAMNGSNSEDDVLQERPSLSTDANETTKMAARTRSSSSSKKSKSRSTKKKDDQLDALEQKWESKFAQFDSRLDKICNFMETSLNPGTSGEQVQNVSTCNQQDSGSSGARRPLQETQTPDVNLPTDNEAEENLHGDVMSLAPGRSERLNIGLFSDEEDGTSMRSDNENHNTVARFSKYLKCQETEETDSGIDNLNQLFGDDAKTKSVSKSVGLVLDKSQIDILSGSWHCEKPEKITAYNEQYKLCFPVHESSEKHLDIPSLDSFTSDLLVKKHGQKAFTVSNKKKTLYTPFLKSVEKLAYQGQAAAKMGIVSSSYMQQALGTLLETLLDKEVNMDRAVQQVRDIFAMSTKSVDQVARAGAFHHLIRRKLVMEDTGLNDIKELKNSLISLPLSSSGVFGDKFEQTLKDRIEKDKQLKELLPELHIGNKPTSFLGKRKNTASNDWQAKRVKQNVNQNSFKSTPSTQRSFQRTSTVSRPDKSENKFEKAGTNFRPSWGNQGKNQQRK
ncbi:unnamed protein product [Mytilus edulis]|uniref:Uncharacterized protein n=1 Tax=Mytilus edulis TaxID=6550 RepID=A0A8S3VBJ8_MYTED|nr:unnamed protein product [Mytilus edulis]